MILDVSIVIEAIGLALLILFVYYAASLLTTFRRGMLQKAWMYVTVGAFFLIFGQFSFIASGMVSLLNDVGMLMRFVGVIFLTLGLRAQCQIWRINEKKLAPTTQSKIEH